ncbi:MAG TPA: DUF1697 domain-containing protein [Polyangiaceae bacterium]|nr:DUF1697 domain-containing protein [Polyangiaceae bacterium]
MPAYAALLRAVNVGGTGKLAMADLRKLCEAAGFADVATYIQSGNVVFTSKRGEASVKKLLSAALAEQLGKPCGVLVRTADELRELLDANPFPRAAPNRVLVLFLDEKPAAAKLKDVATPGGEELRVCGRQVVVHFPNGMGQSKLKLPFRDLATGRNLNTVRKLLAMLEAM